MRQLVTVRTVSELLPIEGADRIELAKVDGWQCVVKKGEFSVGDRGLYFEIDSMLPTTDQRFAFLAKGKVQPHARVKTVRLKGQLSQGLLMPLRDFPEATAYVIGSNMVRETLGVDLAEQNLTDLLKVQKYEPPLPTGGQQKGTFPTQLVPKTDQERIQNMPSVLEGGSFLDYEVTEKLDGTSCTIWMHVSQDDLLHLEDVDVNTPEGIEKWKDFACGVASRNWEMQKDDDNVYSKMLRENDLVNKLWELGRNLAIQGEIIGPGIQGNKYKLAAQTFYVFDIYDLDKKRYLPFYERWELAEQLGLKHVPVLRDELHAHFHWDTQTNERGDPLTLENVLAIANGKSALHPDTMREGLVFKRINGQGSFKAISNAWLLKHE